MSALLVGLTQGKEIIGVDIFAELLLMVYKTKCKGNTNIVEVYEMCTSMCM